MHNKLPPASVQPLAFPAATRFDRIVAKDKILQQSHASAAIKKLLAQQIDRIRCSHELSEDKLNLQSSPAAPKILIIQLELKTNAIDHRLLGTIDKAFGVPVIFELNYQQQIAYAACYRRQMHLIFPSIQQIAYAACYRRRGKKDPQQWVFSDYFITAWVKQNNPTQALPIALSLESLYEQLLGLVLPLSGNGTLEERIETISQIRQLEKEAEKLQSRIKKEKQFNRRVELNRQLRSIMTEIDQLRQ